MNRQDKHIDTHSIIKYVTTVAIITFMVGVSEILGEREIIFPEIAAIAVGAFAAPSFAWNTNYKRIFILITLSAAAGVLIVKYVPLPSAFQAVIAFALSQLIFINSGTSFAPMISALVLPVLLQTTSVVYLGTAVTFTLLILAVRFIFEKTGTAEKLSFTPASPPKRNTYLLTFIRILTGGAILAAAVFSGHQFVAAPPFLVAFTEMSKPGSKAVKSPFKVFAVISACGITGAVIRYVLTIKLEVFPLAASAMLTAVIFLLIMKSSKAFIPPAGAIAVLSMLIPADKVIYYPLECILGAFLVVLTSNAVAFISQKTNLTSNPPAQ